jgi:hypothetical protein
MSVAESQPATPKPSIRWFHITPGRLVIVFLVAEAFLWLSDRLHWLAWHKGYSTDRVTLAYNRQAEVSGTSDQNGTVRAIIRDRLGRQVSDQVPALGPGVDGAVQRIDTAYEVRGMVISITSLDAPVGGNVVNQVALTYNAFRQLVDDAQEHAGAVTSGTPSVGYGYADGSQNTIRPTEVIYPNGNVLGLNYNATASDALSRVDQITFNGQPVAGYEYLGLGSVINLKYPEPNVTMALNDGLGNYPGLDIFGRVVNLLWTAASSSLSGSSSSSSGPTALVNLG